MSTPNDRLRTLIESLCVATDQSRIKWMLGSQPDIYVAKINENRIEVFPDGSEIRINIYDNEGSLVDSFDDIQLKNDIPVNISYPSYYMAMLALHQNARRNATGADKVIDDMISSLGVDSLNDEPPF